MCCYFSTVSFPVISFDQELQQQLIIETRDLKKTRNFYQKLIQQERKSKGRVTASSCSNRSAQLTAGSIRLCMCLKGPESKSMLLKLKSQFEELRSRVVFLECVKKYLEVETKLLVCLLIYFLSTVNANVFLCAWRFWTSTDGVWRFHCCPRWLSMDLVLWIFSPPRTRRCSASVPAEGRAPCRVDLLWASWVIFMQGSKPLFCLFDMSGVTFVSTNGCKIHLKLWHLTNATSQIWTRIQTREVILYFLLTFVCSGGYAVQSDTLLNSL